MPVRGVIFDVDGTLVDSNDAHANAWVDALRDAGFDVSFARIRDMIGMGGDKIIPDVTGWNPESGEAKALAARRGEIFNERYLPHLQSFPDVRALFLRMRKDRLELSIATSAKPDELKALLRIANVADLVSETASKTADERSKPDPDIVDAAVHRSDFDAAQLVMVGDTPYDIEAAGRAGVRAIGFRCGGWPDDRLAGAAQIYDGPWDMLARYCEVEQMFERK